MPGVMGFHGFLPGLSGGSEACALTNGTAADQNAPPGAWEDCSQALRRISQWTGGGDGRGLLILVTPLEAAALEGAAEPRIWNKANMRPNNCSLPYFGWDGGVERPLFPSTRDE